MVNFAHYTLVIKAQNTQCCPGKLSCLHSVAFQVSMLVARLCSSQLSARALQTVCLWAVQRTAAVAVLSERRETNNKEVVQQLSECRGTNQAIRCQWLVFIDYV